MKDYVKCSNCDFKGLVLTGSEVCPSCNEDGSFMWVDENMQEVDDDFMVHNYNKDGSINCAVCEEPVSTQEQGHYREDECETVCGGCYTEWLEEKRRKETARSNIEEFKVIVKTTTYYQVDVKAKSQDDALILAKDVDGGEWEFVEDGDTEYINPKEYN